MFAPGPVPTRALIGADFWAKGLAANRHVLEAFLGHHHEQGLSPRRLLAEELFRPSTHETPLEWRAPNEP